MSLSTVKRLVSGKLLLFLSACVPYHQIYYPAGGAYSGYGVTQRSYYSRYPYRYENHLYSYSSNYPDNSIHRHDVYNSPSSRNRSYVRPIPSNGYSYSHNHTDRKQQHFDYQGSVPAYPGRKNHHDPLGNYNWSKPSTDRSLEYNKLQHGRSNPDLQNHGQNQRSHENWRNQIKEQQHYAQENDKRIHYENHEQAKNQRESRRRNHYQ